MYPRIGECDETYGGNNINYGIPQAAASTPSSSYSMRPYLRTQQEWSTHLFHCLDDPAICFVTCCCPCITFGHIAEIVNKGNPTLTGRACLYSCNYRSKMRAQFDLPEAPCMDCLVHFCCETCALSQEYRQLRNLGFDLSIGWEANMERQRQGITVAPQILAAS
ncbi:cell number regulator 2-like [Senna tora]|uniref:Cell number regulator 2-like n=1 Tax=Senna tora TaxID=362788 RepID=A0A834X8F6_9FABA|nr:cell number regulator 2-like [Senna tora]